MTLRAGDYPDEQVPTSRRHTADQVLFLATLRGSEGLTQAEASQWARKGHGAVSGALTRLHRADALARLSAKRGRQYVYVLPEHVGGRELSHYRPHKGTGTNVTIDREDLNQVVFEAMALTGTIAEAQFKVAQFLLAHGVHVDG